ncbi:MAG: hypothetical protein Pg6C_20070 [Treponemataceae bacterium]|nr:MAG: hypothetical protein Pg6C_20070 [Treponemataceae bacterium]
MRARYKQTILKTAFSQSIGSKCGRRDIRRTPFGYNRGKDGMPAHPPAPVRAFSRTQTSCLIPCPLLKFHFCADTVDMRKISSFVVCLLVFFAEFLRAQSLPLYQLPEHLPPKEELLFHQRPLAATESGLYEIVGANTPVPLWTGGRVTHIERVVINGAEKWFFVTEKGLYSSADLKTFIPAGDRLPHLVIKEYENGKTNLVRQAQALKDFAVHPENPDIMVTATKNYVFLTRDGGKTWQNLGFSAKSTGTKAVAVANLPVTSGRGAGTSELVVFLSHAFYGFACIPLDLLTPIASRTTTNAKHSDSMKTSELNPDLKPIDVLTERTHDEWLDGIPPVRHTRIPASSFMLETLPVTSFITAFTNCAKNQLVTMLKKIGDVAINCNWFLTLASIRNSITVYRAEGKSRQQPESGG